MKPTGDTAGFSLSLWDRTSAACACVLGALLHGPLRSSRAKQSVRGEGLLPSGHFVAELFAPLTHLLCAAFAPSVPCSYWYWAYHPPAMPYSNSAIIPH